MDPVTHFEMPAENKQRMRSFYENVFGWQTQQLGEEMGEYVIVTTTETDSNRMITKPGGINGGFYQKTEDPLSHHPSIVIQVGNIEESLKKIESSGGRLSGTIQEIPGVGKFASILDTEGNKVGLMQPNNPV